MLVIFLNFNFKNCEEKFWLKPLQVCGNFNKFLVLPRKTLYLISPGCNFSRFAIFCLLFFSALFNISSTLCDERPRLPSSSNLFSLLSSLLTSSFLKVPRASNSSVKLLEYLAAVGGCPGTDVLPSVSSLQEEIDITRTFLWMFDFLWSEVCTDNIYILLIVSSIPVQTQSVQSQIKKKNIKKFGWSCF